MVVEPFILFFSTLNVVAQTIQSYKPPSPNGFIGLGMGINDYGLGIGAELNVNKKLWLYGIGGYSTWGYRLTSGLTFYPGLNGFKSSVTIGYSYASGQKDHISKLNVEQFNGVVEKNVLLDLYPISTLNLIYSYNVIVGRKSKLVFSGGYSIVLTEELYENKSGYQLTDGSKEFIEFMAPGGIVVGIKFMIGSLM